MERVSLDGMWIGCHWMGCGEGVRGWCVERVSEDGVWRGCEWMGCGEGVGGYLIYCIQIF